MYPPASFCVRCGVDNSANAGGVECVNVAGAGAVCGSEHLSLEICGGGIRAGVAGAIGVSHVAAAGEHRPVRDDQRGASLFRWLLRDCDFLEADEVVSSQSIHCGVRVVAGECADCFSPARSRHVGISIASRMDCRESSDAGIALAVCARIAIPGPAFMRLIVGVFGIAIILIVIWVVLRMVAMREKE